jgi:Tfp pilus assembly PilM family ATPase
MATVLGIDTGSWRTRVAAMDGSFRRFVVSGVAEVGAAEATLLGEGVRGPSSGMETEHALAGVAELRAADPRWDFAQRVAAFPLDGGMVKLVRLPFGERQAIQKALPSEVESAVPWDMEDMVLGTHILEATPTGSRTACFIAPKDDVRARVEALKAVGAEPRSLVFDADVLATYNDGGVQVIVDVGHRRTVLALAQHGKLVAARLVPSGGADLTAALAEATGWSLADAEAAKHTARVPAPAGMVDGWDEDDATDVAGPPAWHAPLVVAVDAWIADVRAELIALEDESGLGIDELLTCGGGSRLGGLEGRLAQAVGVGVRQVIVPDGHGPEFALALALVRVAANEREATDLRVGDLAYHGHAELLWRATTATVLGGAFFLVAALALFSFQLMEANGKLDEVDAAIVSAVTTAVPGTASSRIEGQPTMALAILQESVAATQARIDALGSTISGVPPTLDLLRQVSASVPASPEARIDVKELNIAEEAISFKAETDSYESAARIESGLQRVAIFAGAKKSEEKKVGEFVTFTLNIPLGATDEAAADGGTAPAKEGGG